MTSFRDYLRENAKFYCPPVECHQTAFTAVTDVEVEQVFARWDSDHTVLEAHHDAQMVDALINVHNEELGETLVPESMERRFQRHYEDDVLRTRVIRTESDGYVDRGHIGVLEAIMRSLGNPVDVTNETAAPETRSKVHFVLTTLRGKFEVKFHLSSTWLQKTFLNCPMAGMTEMVKLASRYGWIRKGPRQE